MVCFNSAISLIAAIETEDSEVAKLAVSCIVINKTPNGNYDFLFLKRAEAPYKWCPPGGGVKKGESMLSAVKREVFEETGLTVKVKCPVDTWSGIRNDTLVFSVTYIGEVHTEKVILSSEHIDFMWVPLKKLTKTNIQTDYKISDWKYFLCLSKVQRTINSANFREI